MKFLLLGTFDTKNVELSYIEHKLASFGDVITLDIGVYSSHNGYTFTDLIEGSDYEGVNLANVDKNESMAILCELLPDFTKKLYETEKFDGIISIGGGCGTTLAGKAMQKLPFGMPKVLVSTVISTVRGFDFYGSSDVCLFPAILDISGLNHISKDIFDRAVHSLVGMCKFNTSPTKLNKKIRIGMSMFGVTQRCIDNIKKILESDDSLELYVFHATGSGGDTLESMVEDGLLDYVIDITTTELTDSLFGGILSSTSKRLTAKSPRIISVGASEMINFGKIDTVPPSYNQNLKYAFNENTTLVRINLDQAISLASLLSTKINDLIDNGSDIKVLLPINGFSQLNAPNNDFFDSKINLAFIEFIKKHVHNGHVKVIDSNINDKLFAQEVVKTFYQMKNRRI